MTLDSSTSKAVFSGNGTAKEFPFSFRVWGAQELKVLVSLAENDREFDVTASCGIALSATGGTVTYPASGEPLPVGARLAIVRAMPFLQGDNYVSGTRFDPEVIETALDVACAERQQLRETLERAVVIPPTWEGDVPLKKILDASDRSAAAATAAENSAAAALLTLSDVNAAGAGWVAGIRTEGAIQCLNVATEGASKKTALHDEGDVILAALETRYANTLSAALRAEAAASGISGFAQNRNLVMRWNIPATGDGAFHLSRTVCDGASDDTLTIAAADVWAVLPESSTLSIDATGHLILSLPFAQAAA